MAPRRFSITLSSRSFLELAEQLPDALRWYDDRLADQGVESLVFGLQGGKVLVIKNGSPQGVLKKAV